MFNRAWYLITMALIAASGAWANSIYNVIINTAPQVGHSAGPFAIELQLNDGSGTGDANNTATLGNFAFGSGGPSGLASGLGGMIGDLGSSITMSDSSFFNQFIQNFDPGSFFLASN